MELERKRKRQDDKKKKEDRRKKRAHSASRIAIFFNTILLGNKRKRLRSGTIRFQALWRGSITRKAHADIIRTLEEYMTFYSIWGNCLVLTSSIRLVILDWAAIRGHHTFFKQPELVEGDSDERKATDEKLTKSMEDVLNLMEEEATILEDDMEEIDGLPLVRHKKIQRVQDVYHHPRLLLQKD